MKIGKTYLPLILVAAAQLAPVFAHAAELSVVKNNDVSYVSGGAGDDEQDQLNAMADRFNLKVTMALSNGDYVSGVALSIRDTRGEKVLETVANGPILLASLKPGTYTVDASLNGKKLEKPAQVGATGRQELAFAWASE